MGDDRQAVFHQHALRRVFVPSSTPRPGAVEPFPPWVCGAKLCNLWVDQGAVGGGGGWPGMQPRDMLLVLQSPPFEQPACVFLREANASHTPPPLPLHPRALLFRPCKSRPRVMCRASPRTTAWLALPASCFVCVCETSPVCGRAGPLDRPHATPTPWLAGVGPRARTRCW